MAKEYSYRGKKLEELKKLSINELAEAFPARQRRKIKRGFSEKEKDFLEKVNKKDNVKTHLRSMIVLPLMVGKTIKIHNGKEFIVVRVQEDMIGHYLGEFALSRKRPSHNSPGVGATKSSSALSVR